jgi:phospholipase/lecithinase/hemolysin
VKKRLLHFIVLLSIILTTFSAESTTRQHGSPINNIRRIIVFGDSLSDNGNVFLLTQQLHQIDRTIPILPTPTLYWQGRFSDGPTWTNYMAFLLHFISSLNPTLRESEQFQNYAYGGAWAESDGHVFPMPLDFQTDDYLFKNTPDPSASDNPPFSQDLIFLWIGGNDYLNQGLDTPPVLRPPKQSTDLVIKSIHDNVIKLIKAGCRHFVVIGLPDLSRIPEIVLRDPDYRDLAPNLATTSQLHNQKLKQLVDIFSAQYPYVHFTFVSINQLFEKEYRDAKLRARAYFNQTGQSQKATSPCLIEKIDPDPAHVKLFGLNPILAMTVTPDNLSDPTASYHQCDLHQMHDQRSPFNYLTDYQAGGIFFDHIHPLTQIHAKIALDICHRLIQMGYEFYQSSSDTFLPIDCHQYSVDRLVSNIEQAPFPTSH